MYIYQVNQASLWVIGIFKLREQKRSVPREAGPDRRVLGLRLWRSFKAGTATTIISIAEP
jgi:hypothetical protein